MPSRHLDWLKQAENDLQMARDAQASDHHEWACFAAHQAAEKAVKGLHAYLLQDVWGHVVSMLLNELPDRVTVPAVLKDKAKVLDNHYIPTRYPNGHAAGAPCEYYSRLQSGEAIGYAGEIIQFARSQMAGA